MSDDETAPEMLTRLGTDAMLWAQEFNKTAVKLGYSEMDEGWLIGWFANAIENCDVIRCNQLRAELAAVTAERDRLREALKDALVWLGDPHGGRPVMSVDSIRNIANRAALEGVKEKSGAGNE